jgi:hypothetical protein
MNSRQRFWFVLLVVAVWAVIIVISGRNEPPITAAPIPVSAAELAQLDAQARSLCARERHRSAGYIALPDGVLVCDKPAAASRARSEITILTRAEVRP